MTSNLRGKIEPDMIAIIENIRDKNSSEYKDLIAMLQDLTSKKDYYMTNLGDGPKMFTLTVLDRSSGGRPKRRFAFPYNWA